MAIASEEPKRKSSLKYLRKPRCWLSAQLLLAWNCKAAITVWLLKAKHQHNLIWVLQWQSYNTIFVFAVISVHKQIDIQYFIIQMKRTLKELELQSSVSSYTRYPSLLQHSSNHSCWISNFIFPAVQVSPKVLLILNFVSKRLSNI